jgi:hypothetical protein
VRATRPPVDSESDLAAHQRRQWHEVLRGVEERHEASDDAEELESGT